MAQVCSCCEQHFQGDLGWLGGVADDIFGVVGGFHACAELFEIASWGEEKKDEVSLCIGVVSEKEFEAHFVARLM